MNVWSFFFAVYEFFCTFSSQISLSSENLYHHKIRPGEIVLQFGHSGTIVIIGGLGGKGNEGPFGAKRPLNPPAARRVLLPGARFRDGFHILTDTQLIGRPAHRGLPGKERRL